MHKLLKSLKYAIICIYKKHCQIRKMQRDIFCPFRTIICHIFSKRTNIFWNLNQKVAGTAFGEKFAFQFHFKLAQNYVKIRQIYLPFAKVYLPFAKQGFSYSKLRPCVVKINPWWVEKVWWFYLFRTKMHFELKSYVWFINWSR